MKQSIESKWQSRLRHLELQQAEKEQKMLSRIQELDSEKQERCLNLEREGEI